MKIIIDKREAKLIEKINELLPLYKFENVELITDVLDLGDILVKNDDEELLLIERKTIADLLSSIKDGRYAEQSLRLYNNELPNNRIVYLVEGVVPGSVKNIIYSTMTSLNVFKGFSIMKTNHIDETADWLLIMVDKMNRSIKNNKKPFSTENVTYCDVIKTIKKDNINKENIGEIMLMQIPGISAILAKAILEKFENFHDFIIKINENPSCLDGMTYNSNGKERKINKNCIESIKEYLANF